MARPLRLLLVEDSSDDAVLLVRHLAREGWKSTTLKPGDKISVTVFPLRNDEKGGQYISVTLPDGRKLGQRESGVI